MEQQWNTIQNILTVCKVTVPAIVALLFGSILLQKENARIVLRCFEMAGVKARGIGKGLRSYDKWGSYLIERGADYHFGAWMSPMIYLLFCILVSLTGYLAGLTQSIVFGFIGAILGALLPGFLVEYMNRRDNEEMLPDLNLIYHALAIQIRAGVYISDALAECYSSVNNERLKRALLHLSGEIVMKSDLEKALENFQSMFCNRYIDSLCMTILQAAESGQAIDLLGDIAEQIKDMELLTQNKKKQKLDRSITFYELGLFAAIIVLVIYVCIDQLFQADMFTMGGLW